MGFLRLNPVSAKRWRRFRSFKRAWYSLCLLSVLYLLSLCSELICNSRPLLVWHDGRPYFPVFFHYSADEFLDNGEKLAVDYRALSRDPAFQEAGGWMLWPPFPYGPNDQVASSELSQHCRVDVYFSPVRGVGLVRLTGEDLRVEEFPGGETLATPPDGGFAGHRLEEFWTVPDDLRQRLLRRVNGEEDDAFETLCEGQGDSETVRARLLRTTGSGQVWMKLLAQNMDGKTKVQHLAFSRGEDEPDLGGEVMEHMDEALRARVLEEVRRAFSGRTDGLAVGSDRCYGQAGTETGGRSGDEVLLGGRPYTMMCELERVEHPFRPVPGHWLGLDDAGRDVLARILYGLRTSLTFGLVLVVSSMLFGTLIGCLQGYLGGKVDMLGQRAIEIWSALPFLYIVILMGSLFGTGFWLLIVCYALFNWIGVSYYMRAEMLRLRRQPFVEAARCLGLPWWTVVWRHILPNALVPLVTLVPFSLVGAIGALAALDYLGFGLPPPTPSLGQLLQQAQVQREAWWLILYPSVALFVVMLLCVFIGEGVREAFDPKRQSRIQ